jgi:hypothetical protein
MAEGLSERGRPIYGPTPPGQGVPCSRQSPLTGAEVRIIAEFAGSVPAAGTVLGAGTVLDPEACSACGNELRQAQGSGRAGRARQGPGRMKEAGQGG